MVKHLLNRPLRVILFVDVLVLIAVAMIAPIQAIFVQQIGGDILDAGLASSIFAVVAGVTVAIAGLFSDRVKNKKSIVALGYLVTGFGFLGYTVVSSVAQLFIVQIIIGLSQAFYAPAFDALYSEQTGKKKAGSRWGLWEAGNYFAIAIGAALGAWIAKQFSFDTLFAVMASICFASAVYLFTTPRQLFDHHEAKE